MHEKQVIRVMRGDEVGKLAMIVRVFGNEDYLDVKYLASQEPATLLAKNVTIANDMFKESWEIWHLTDIVDGKVYAMCGPELNQPGPMLPDIPSSNSAVCKFCQMIARGEEILSDAEEAICPVCQSNLIEELRVQHDALTSGKSEIRCRKCASELDVVVKQTFDVRMRMNAADAAR